MEYLNLKQAVKGIEKKGQKAFIISLVKNSIISKGQAGHLIIELNLFN